MKTSDLVFFDFETASQLSLKTAGTSRYAYDDSTIPLILAYAIGDGPAQVWHADGAGLQWAGAPRDLAQAYEAGATFAAFNAHFDRTIWNAFFTDDSPLKPEDVIDVMAQAVAAGLPPSLEGAATKCGLEGKQKDGKALIKRFCVPSSKTGIIASPADHPEEWHRFCSYAAIDVEQMREVYRRTLPLTGRELREYWAAERINERGVGVDRSLARRADTMAVLALREANDRVAELTGGQITAVTQVQRLGPWLWDSLPDAKARSFIDKAGFIGAAEDEPEDDEEGDGTVGSLVLKRQRLELLVAYLRSEWEGVDDLIEVIEARIWGGGSSFKKFASILNQSTDDDPRLRGQLVFMGAAQTGRFSSKGVQVHNLTREHLRADEELVIDRLLSPPTMTPRELTELGAPDPDTKLPIPGLRKLALIVRPTLVSTAGKTFLWSDWSNIEARVLPWLAGPRARAAVEKLALFSAIDAESHLPKDQRRPGMYETTAGAMWKVDPRTIGKEDPLRQRGKIAELSLGFAGGRRALQSMAAQSKMFFSDEEGFEIVKLWREANPWAPNFWTLLWEAAMEAVKDPGGIYPAGRLGFKFVPGYHGGTLFMELPSGRMLSYPSLKAREEDEPVCDALGVQLLDHDGKPMTQKRLIWRYRRGYGMSRLWKGILAENATQAVAADILRGTLVRMEDYPQMPVVLHVHDEVVAEVDEGMAERLLPHLQGVMRQGFPWSEGLPLWSDETISPYYTKAHS